jgi:hypothetical protein
MGRIGYYVSFEVVVNAHDDNDSMRSLPGREFAWPRDIQSITVARSFREKPVLPARPRGTGPRSSSTAPSWICSAPWSTRTRIPIFVFKDSSAAMTVRTGSYGGPGDAGPGARRKGDRHVEPGMCLLREKRADDIVLAAFYHLAAGGAEKGGAFLRGR